MGCYGHHDSHFTDEKITTGKFNSNNKIISEGPWEGSGGAGTKDQCGDTLIGQKGSSLPPPPPASLAVRSPQDFKAATSSFPGGLFLPLWRHPSDPPHSPVLTGIRNSSCLALCGGTALGSSPRSSLEVRAILEIGNPAHEEGERRCSVLVCEGAPAFIPLWKERTF